MYLENETRVTNSELHNSSRKYHSTALRCVGCAQFSLEMWRLKAFIWTEHWTLGSVIHSSTRKKKSHRNKLKIQSHSNPARPCPLMSLWEYQWVIDLQGLHSCKWQAPYYSYVGTYCHPTVITCFCFIPCHYHPRNRLAKIRQNVSNFKILLKIFLKNFRIQIKITVYRPFSGPGPQASAFTILCICFALLERGKTALSCPMDIRMAVRKAWENDSNFY